MEKLKTVYLLKKCFEKMTQILAEISDDVFLII